jgi:hypothetical protein
MEMRALSYCCYQNCSTKAFPVNRMTSYIDSTAKAGPKDGRMYTIQALWQESASSVTVGELYASSLLLDEKRSGLNALVTERIKSKVMPTDKLGMVEVNNVCDGGPALLAALRAL